MPRTSANTVLVALAELTVRATYPAPNHCRNCQTSAPASAPGSTCL